MDKRYLTILEVSQKQAYIFQSNKLRDNIVNSAVIAWIMDADYMEETAGDFFRKGENLVYSGGGHTVLQFPSREQAVDFTKIMTRTIRRDYPGIEVFARTIEYDETKMPAVNLKELTRALEWKKSIRASSFHQGSFGVEKTDTNTQKPIQLCMNTITKMPDKEERTDKELSPEGFHRVYEFEQLGGTKDSSNFIAVVHIDGNAMGKRVEKVHEKYGGQDWENCRQQLNQFSRSIDMDFKAAYKEMAEQVAAQVREGKLDALSLTEDRFPIRRIITAGDDICFVTEGRIGLECARIFIEKLAGKKNAVDGGGYAACAGAAIVHQKYPFYRAYELAEMLCSNAKKYAASVSSDGTGRDVSAIDWHIEFGEVKDTLEEIRANYSDADGGRIYGRPYIVHAESSVGKAGTALCYCEVRRLLIKLQDEESCARGTLKELRNVLKQGQAAADHFLKFHKIEELVSYDLHKNRKVLFDAIEMVDTFIAIDGKEGLE